MQKLYQRNVLIQAGPDAKAKTVHQDNLKLVRGRSQLQDNWIEEMVRKSTYQAPIDKVHLSSEGSDNEDGLEPLEPDLEAIPLDTSSLIEDTESVSSDEEVEESEISPKAVSLPRLPGPNVDITERAPSVVSHELLSHLETVVEPEQTSPREGASRSQTAPPTESATKTPLPDLTADHEIPSPILDEDTPMVPDLDPRTDLELRDMSLDSMAEEGLIELLTCVEPQLESANSPITEARDGIPTMEEPPEMEVEIESPSSSSEEDMEEDIEDEAEREESRTVEVTPPGENLPTVPPNETIPKSPLVPPVTPPAAETSRPLPRRGARVRTKVKPYQSESFGPKRPRTKTRARQKNG